MSDTDADAMPEEAPSYVALLRGINVGGRNLIRMSDLAACFSAHGFEDVATYIQSGNVLFRADEQNRAELVARIEQMLSSAFDYRACVALRDADEMRAVVDEAPDRFGREPDRFRYDVVFLVPPLTPDAVMEDLAPREGVDRVWAGRDVLYFSRLTVRAAQSRLSRLASMPVYQRMTIRNWNTTTKLLQLMGVDG